MQRVSCEVRSRPHTRSSETCALTIRGLEAPYEYEGRHDTPQGAPPIGTQRRS